MLLRIFSRLLSKGSSILMMMLQDVKSNVETDVKRRKPVAEQAQVPLSFPSRLPEKFSRFVRTRRLFDVLTCCVIVTLPTGCILLGLSISDHFGPPPRQYADPLVVVEVTGLNYSWYNSHNLTVRFVGGLGNQMFQYASLYGIAKATGLKPVMAGRRHKLTSTFADLRCIKATDRDEAIRVRDGPGYLAYVERRSNAFENRAFSLNFMKNIRLVGFFQSWRYFDHVRSDVRRQLSGFSPRIEVEVREYILSMLTSHAAVGGDRVPPRLIGVHVRRGDFLEEANREKGYVAADTYFYRRAMEFFLGRFGSAVFVVCSDDPEWAVGRIKSTGRGSVVVHSKFSNRYDPAYDLKLLASCNHTIFSGSTFGWWGAWLSGGQVIYSRDFPRPDSQLASQFRSSDYYLPQWIPM